MTKKVETPESAFEPAEGTEVEKEFTVDDFILGNVTDDTFEHGVEVTPKPEEKSKTDNDDVRYQYWQSQFDKGQVANKELREQLSEMQGRFAGVTEKLLEKPETPSPVMSDSEKFPEPPRQPVVPSGFSEDDAKENPSGSSGKYIQDMQQYYDNMMQYTNLKAEYANKRLDELDQRETERKEEYVQTEKVRQENLKRLAVIAKTVQDTYGATEEQAIDFIRKMSSPESKSLGNLWQLYQLQSGVVPSSGRPSKEFQQQRKSAGYPSPFGSLPGSSHVDKRKVEDVIMDDIIEDFKSRNPFD